MSAPRLEVVKRTSVWAFTAFCGLALADALWAAGHDPSLQNRVYVAVAAGSALVAVVALVGWLRGPRGRALQLFEVALLAQVLGVQFFRLLAASFQGYLTAFVSLALIGLCRAMLFELYVKSVTLKGFKSFASATTLRFEPGITCIVGPTGRASPTSSTPSPGSWGSRAPRACAAARWKTSSSPAPPGGRRWAAPRSA
jgi:hypothetical protein